MLFFGRGCRDFNERVGFERLGLTNAAHAREPARACTCARDVGARARTVDARCDEINASESK